MTICAAAPCGLDNQYVRIRRDLVTSGRWARLWRDGGTPAVSLLPVLALLGRGRGSSGASVGIDRLSALSGLQGALFEAGFRSLVEAGLIYDLGSRFPTVKRFAVGTDVVSSESCTRFTIPGAVFTSGVWSRLAARQRLILLVLCAVVRNDSRFDDESTAQGRWRRNASDWASPIDTSHNLRWNTPRCGAISTAALSSLTGIEDPFVVLSELERLARHGSEVVHARIVSPEIWVYLPARWWSPADV